MKILIAFLLLLTVITADQFAFPQQDENNDALEFLKGFLEGVGGTGDIEKFKECIKEFEQVFKKIVEALNHLKKMKLDEIKKGLQLLFEAILEILTYLKPCMKGFQKLEKLILALAHPNIVKIAMNIFMHPKQFINDIVKAIECFSKKDLFCAGKSVGGLLKVMFLSLMEGLNQNALDFLKGFLEGIGESGDIEKLKECIKEFEQIFKKIEEALHHLKKMKLDDIKKGLKLLFEAVHELLKYLQPCMKGFLKLEKLVLAIAHANLFSIAMHIFMHPKQFIQDIIKAIECFAKKDLHCAGKAVGGLLKVMFLSLMQPAESDAVEFLKGFLEGIKAEEELVHLMDCLKNLDEIFERMREALHLLKKMTLHDVISGILKLIAAMKDFMDMLKPCVQDCPIMKKLIQAIKNAHLHKMAASFLHMLRNLLLT